MTNSGINPPVSGGSELTSIRGNIRNYFEKAILSGALAPGTRLPTTRMLAEKFRTTPANVHAAMTVLRRAGRIERKKRLGTRVSDRGPRERIAFTVPGPAWHESAYLRRLWTEFSAAATAVGWDCELLVAAPEAAGERLAAEFASGTITAAVTAAFLAPNHHELRAAGYALISSSASDSGFRGYPMRAELNRAFEAFRRRGVRRAGMISSGADGERRRAFENAAIESGIETRPEWLRFRPDGLAGHYERFREWGYDEFRELWKCAERPDGLYVFTDDPIPGVLLGTAAEHLRLGTDLHLVLFRNRELPTLCPAAADFVEVSIAEAAGSMLRQALRLRRGESGEPECLIPELRSNSPGN